MEDDSEELPARAVNQYCYVANHLYVCGVLSGLL